MAGVMAAARRWRRSNGGGVLGIPRKFRLGSIFIVPMKSQMQHMSHEPMKPTPIPLIRAALALATLVSSTGVAAPPANPDAAGSGPVPLIVIDDVPSKYAIQNLARQAGLNYILDPRVPGASFGPGRLVDMQS